jgi:(E)-4-hydroxy-3-methylbut-2-enyl-diphosphate synthase
VITRVVRVGAVELGGGLPPPVQTMTDTDTADAEATLAQIGRCARSGADIVRVAVPGAQVIAAFRRIASESPVPVIADVHFDWRLAVSALKAGASGVRVNPGNIGGESKLMRVVEACARQGACLRVGVNMGSLEREFAERLGRTPEAMCASAAAAAEMVERSGFRNFKVSLKASGVSDTVRAARLFARISDVPQHLGVTEAGPMVAGIAKSAVALAALLSEGTGDTVRVSLTAPPETECEAAVEILRALGLRRGGVEYVSCPTCGRCRIDLASLLAEVKSRLADVKAPLKVAVMGCVVNGPGEAREADLGVAGGSGGGKLFVRGSFVSELPYESLAPALEELARKILREREAGDGAAEDAGGKAAGNAGGKGAGKAGAAGKPGPAWDGP